MKVKIGTRRPYNSNCTGAWYLYLKSIESGADDSIYAFDERVNHTSFMQK